MLRTPEMLASWSACPVNLLTSWSACPVNPLVARNDEFIVTDFEKSS